MAIVSGSGHPRIYRIDGDGSTSILLKELRFLIKDKSIIPSEFEKAKLKYNAKKGLGACDTESYYPLRFISDNKELWISSVATGSNDKFSSALLAVFSIMKFPITYDDKEYIRHRKCVNKTYKKPETCQP